MLTGIVASSLYAPPVAFGQENGMRNEELCPFCEGKTRKNERECFSLYCERCDAEKLNDGRWVEDVDNLRIEQERSGE